MTRTRQAVQPAVWRFLDSRLCERLPRSVGCMPAPPTLRRNSRSAAQKHSVRSASSAGPGSAAAPTRERAEARKAGMKSTQWSAAWLPPWPSKTPKHVMVDRLCAAAACGGGVSRPPSRSSRRISLILAALECDKSASVSSSHSRGND